MNSEKWEQAKQLYENALKCAPDERSQFLAENCGGDEELLREVESLLAFSDQSADFMERPAVEEMAELIVAKNSPAGKKILQYNVIKLLGEGGMGEVYLAEDTRLKRLIALKILPTSLGENKQFVRRFEREACAASALNHPNILTVHEFGEENGMNFIASEYVKGETLRERLKNGTPLTLSEALGITVQIAAALRAAHESDIIHRDIKPENVMIRDDGLVKVLDFGLAKLTPGKNEFFDSEGETALQTTIGTIMGTVGYMSPEQARGRETDARTDIWSLGIVLYEMLVGRPPFAGETSSDTLAEILMQEPGAIDGLPDELARILDKALIKERDERYQTVKDMLLDLENFKRELDSSSFFDSLKNRPLPGTTGKTAIIYKNTEQITTGPPRLSNRTLVAAGVLLVALAVLGGVIIQKFTQTQVQQPPNRLDSLRNKKLITWGAEAGEEEVGARFSPAGTMIAFAQTNNGQSNILTRQVPEGKINPVTEGKEGKYYNPIWSPDGQRIAFILNRDNQREIWSIPFSGGERTFIRTAEAANTYLLKYSKDGKKIYFQASEPQTGLNVFALDLESKKITRLTNFDPAGQAQFFNISPDEEQIAYSSLAGDRLHIFVMTIKDGRPVQVTNDNDASDELPFWLPDGKRIIYSSKRDDIFQPRVAYLDEERTEPINLQLSDTLINDVSSDGTRILFQQSQEESDLWKIGIDGKNETQITSDPGLELWPDISSDGKNIVFQEVTESKHLLEGTVLIRSLDDKQQISVASNGFSPVFSPDGQKVAFLRTEGQLRDLWITGRNGDGELRLTTGGIWFPGHSEVPYNRAQVRDFTWSRDGASLIFCAVKDGLSNVWQAAGDGSRELRQISNNTDENTRLYSPIFSPDGTKAAWTSRPPGAIHPKDLYLWDGENSALLFSPESTIKLIGWSGNNLVVAAIPKDRSTADPGDILLMLVTAKNRTKDLASIGTAYFNNIQLSPDGRRIAFATREDEKDNIRIVSVAGGKSARITANIEPTTHISGLAWSPDGKTIYFGKQKSMSTIWMIENFK